MDEKDASLEQERRECLEQQEAFYNQAYEGFLKAVSTASKKMKDRAFDLKEEIIREIKDSKA